MLKGYLAIITIFLTVGSFYALVPPLSAHALSGGTTPNPAIPVNLSNDSSTATYPNEQAVGLHVYIAWTEGSGGIKFRTSWDGGVHWIPSRNVPALTLSPPGGIAQYPMVSVNGSYVYVVWSQNVESYGVQMFIAISSNYGKNFSSAVMISPSTSSDNFITPVIVSQGSDVYVGYDDNQCDCSYVISSTNHGASWNSPAMSGRAHEPQLYAWGQYAYEISDGGFIYSSDNGQQWSNIYISGCCGSEPWIWGYGSNVYVAWETKGSQSQIYVAYSNNNGANWNGGNLLTSTLPDSWAPMIWARGSSAWIAEREYPGSKHGQVVVYTTNDGGSSWNSPISLSNNTGGEKTFPYTVASSDGANVFVAWSRLNGPNTWTFMISYSNNSGITWSTPPGINISKNKNGQAGTETDIATGAIASYGPTCYATWQFINGTSDQIYFAAVTE